ncbi:MAG: DNA replication and repair protein RecF, partial [Acidobacteriota bacterium]|nr:DNA replication and repair protein RecF [Acidobacteriota bacterium]
MLLESLEVDKFRNLSGKLACRPGLTILTGDNGHGKTNWLEAIHILATTRSFRTSKLQETICFNSDTAVIRGIVKQSEDIHREMRAVLQGNTKSFTVNEKKETIQRYLGQLHAVVFNADGLEIVRGQPDQRRRFLDSAIVSIYPPFVQTLFDYNRVIKQKNSLLQTARDDAYSIEKTAELLEPWNQQLAALAARVHRARVRYVERLNEVLEKKLFGREEITIRHLSSLEDKGDLADYENLIAERLKIRVQAELLSGYALVGTHRDDLEILFDG